MRPFSTNFVHFSGWPTSETKKRGQALCSVPLCMSQIRCCATLLTQCRLETIRRTFFILASHTQRKPRVSIPTCSCAHASVFLNKRSALCIQSAPIILPTPAPKRITEQPPQRVEMSKRLKDMIDFSNVWPIASHNPKKIIARKPRPRHKEKPVNIATDILPNATTSHSVGSSFLLTNSPFFSNLVSANQILFGIVSSITNVHVKCRSRPFISTASPTKCCAM